MLIHQAKPAAVVAVLLKAVQEQPAPVCCLPAPCTQRGLPGSHPAVLVLVLCEVDGKMQVFHRFGSQAVPLLRKLSCCGPPQSHPESARLTRV